MNESFHFLLSDIKKPACHLSRTKMKLKGETSSYRFLLIYSFHKFHFLLNTYSHMTDFLLRVLWKIKKNSGSVGRESFYCLDLTLYMFDWQHPHFNKLSYWEKDTKERTVGARWRDRENRDLTVPHREKCHLWNHVWKGLKHFIAIFYCTLALEPDES